jgi:hypothetical protein
MAVFALVVIGALVAGTFFAGRLEQRTGLNSMFAEQSFELAEAGATDVLANWAPATFNGLPPGADTTLPPVILGTHRRVVGSFGGPGGGARRGNRLRDPD